jgi:hypothetical protein
MKRALTVLVTAAALLVPATSAGADGGLGEWEYCEREAYAQLNYTDPQSIDHFVDVSVTCTLALKADLTNPRRIDGLRDCFYMNIRKTVKDPVGWGPLFATGGAWRCVFIEYLGRDIKVPPDPARASGA